DSSALQVLWDVHHPYRMVHESPEKTWDVLGDRIRYTHWKDSYLTEKAKQGYQLCLMGEGDIPLKKMYDMLQEKGYDGYFTFEWEITDRKSTRLNSSHVSISYAVFCLKKKKRTRKLQRRTTSRYYISNTTPNS